ncbi:MAG: hypothetical protein GX195_03460 [Firmicutes bacterium]|nr:hypothetical protein [Bacillota bacterium]
MIAKQTGQAKVNPAVYTAAGIMALALIGDSLLYSVLPIYAERLGIPLVMVGAVLSINRWVRLVSNPLAVQIYRRRSVLLPLFFFNRGSGSLHCHVRLSPRHVEFPAGPDCVGVLLFFLSPRLISGCA